MPQGPLGVVMGWLLERGNAVQNQATVAALDPPPGGAVLEVGFGPGHALSMLADRRPLGLLAGIDHSDLMVATARRRLADGRRAAAVDLRVGEAGELPFPDEAFDVAYAINSYHQWPDKAAALAEMAGVLRPGGEIVLSIRDFRVDGRFERPGAGAATARDARPLLEDMGLSVTVEEIAHSPRRATFLVRGRKPD